MTHSFETEVAVETKSILSAVILKHIVFWIAGNQRMEASNFYKEGKYWVPYSLEKFASLYPYATKNQIFYAIQKLIDNGLLIVSKNKNSFDQTNWYTLTEKAERIFHDGLLIFQNDPLKNQKSARASIDSVNIEDKDIFKRENIKRESPIFSNEEESKIIQTAENIWKIYPRKTKYTETLLEIKYAIVRECRTFGEDPKALDRAIVKVYNAAAEYSNRVRRYSPEEQKYIISSAAFFRDSRYLDDPETWKGEAEKNIVYNPDGTRRGVI